MNHALDTVATTLGRLGDRDPRDVRRARALGVLADPQHALDLDDTAHATEPTGDREPADKATSTDHGASAHRSESGADGGDGGDGGESPSEPEAHLGTALRRTKWLSPTLHIHLHLDALHTTEHCETAAGPTTNDTDSEIAGQSEPLVHLGRVDKAGRQLGARSLAVIERWIAGLTPGTRLRVTPVVDLTELISVDSYEIPPPLRRQVAERDHHCRFPWCTNTGRYDIDHIDAYLDPDDGAPPGQTNTHNVTRLCRYHHRVKTRGDWHYVFDPTTDVLTWTSPQGRIYTVDQHGTYPRL